MSERISENGDKDEDPKPSLTKEDYEQKLRDLDKEMEYVEKMWDIQDHYKLMAWGLR